jgi:colanic acid biosynthesis glycosyl transferase WcaI
MRPDQLATPHLKNAAHLVHPSLEESTAPAMPERARDPAGSPPFRRWLILTQYYHPEPGAPQVRLRALSRELVRHGCEVEVLTAMPNYPQGRIWPEYRRRLFATDTVDGVPVHRQWLYAAAGKRSLSRLLCYLSYSAGAALRVPFWQKPDVVFVEAQPITMAIAAHLGKVFRQVPYIYNTPDLQVEIAGDAGWIRTRGLVRAASSLERYLMRQAFCVSTVSHAFIEHFAAVHGISRSRISFLPNGADVDALRPLPPDTLYARELGVAGKIVFTYAGTHAPYQGLEIILEAAERLQDRADIVFLLVGNGPIREQLQRRASGLHLGNVLFRDSPFSEMPRLMSFTRAAIATLSDLPVASKMRLSKVIPPLACGVPVIYVGAGESAGILERNRCGRVVEQRSAERFAAVVRELADAPAQCREMGLRGRALAEADFSWKVIVDRWLAQLSDIQAGADPWGAPLPKADAA